MSTIVAPASGQGKAGIAVIRASGPDAGRALAGLAGGLPEPRRAALRALVDPVTSDLIDRGVVLWFPGPASFTGEDVAEFHVHGGAGVVSAMLRVLIDRFGCVMAEPGAFARRAFAHGKLDLAAVEGLADLIDAETDAQRRQALRQLDGALGRQVEAWAATLLRVMAWAEAALDFSDEGDVPAQSLGAVIADAELVVAEIEAILERGGAGERLREGFVVAIAGAPNAGKSTLLNALSRRDVAIVSPIAGTTRDAIEVRLDLGGWPVTLVDTAGIRDSSDPIEREGVARARRHMERADLVLWLESVESASEASDSAPEEAVVVRTKVDLMENSDSAPKYGEEVVNISAVTGRGLDRLLDLLAARMGSGTAGEPALITRERHRLALMDARASLTRAISAFRAGRGDELVAEDLRLAVRALGRVNGRVDVEDVLGAIFSQFCIGK